jgi:circadian clock protein KaiB
MSDHSDPTIAQQLLEEAARRRQQQRYLLKLYVRGMTGKSLRAIENLQRICNEELSCLYEIEVIDLAEQPGLAREQQIVAIPTLIKQLPDPLRRIVGDLSNHDQVLLGLDLKPRGD